MTEPIVGVPRQRYDLDDIEHRNPGSIATVDRSTPFWKVAPLHRRDVAILFGAYLVLTTVYTLVGLAITHWWEGSPAGRADADVNRWFEDARTPTGDRLAELGAALSNTETKIALVLVMLPLMLYMYRRWHDWTLITAGLMLEVSVFGTSSKLVGRDRPPVEQLDGAPTHSWPSGHIAASVVFYVGLAVVIFWNTTARRSRIAAVAIAVIAPACVITARLYQGMHYPTDAIGGVILGVITLTLVSTLLRRSGTMDPLPLTSAR
jgi:undecaprenyl-diphosphatase